MNFKRLLIILFVLCISIAYGGEPSGAYPSTAIQGWNPDLNVWKPVMVDPLGKMKIDGDVVVSGDTIGLLDAIEALSKGMASETEIINAITLVKTAINNLTFADLDGGKMKVSLAKDDIGILTGISNVKTSVDAVKTSVDGLEIGAPSEIVTRKISLTGGTATNITSGLDSNTRLYIEISTMDKNDELWVNIGAVAVKSQCRRVVGGIGLNLQKSNVVSIISENDVDIFVIEGGKNGI